MTDDAFLREAVELALGEAPGVPAELIGVTVHDGVVRLDGHVPSHDQRKRAGETVWSVDGVRGLVQAIDVRVDQPDGSDDDDVMRGALRALDAAVGPAAARPQVTLQNGWVVLRGTAGDARARAFAADAVSSVPGVRGVVNRLRVAEPEPVSSVRDAVRDALRERRVARAAVAGFPGVDAVLDEPECRT